MNCFTTPQFIDYSLNTPGTQEVALFGNRVIADVVSSGEVTLESGGSLMQYDWCPDKQGKWDTDT